MSVNPSAIGQNKGLSELWRRLRFVFMAVIIYRIGTHIPIPGIDPDKLANIFQQNQGTLLDLFNMFSGGALERMSIMALNIMPYITASIIMSLLEGTTPSLKKRFREEGEEGRRLRTSYVRYGTVFLALIQASGLALGLQNQGLALEPGLMFQIIAVTSLVKRLKSKGYMASEMVFDVCSDKDIEEAFLKISGKPIHIIATITCIYLNNQLQNNVSIAIPSFK